MSLIDGLARPRVLGVSLVLSIAINLLLVGLIAGRISAGWMQPQQVAHPFERGAPFFHGHPHGPIGRAMRKAMPETREQRGALRRLHRQLREELSKPQPDRALLETKLAAIRAEMQATQEKMHTAFLDAVLAMPVTERREMLEGMHHTRPGMHWRGR